MKNWVNTLLVFSTFVLLHLAVMPFVGFLTGSGEISLFLGVVLAIVFMFSAKFILDRGYLNNRKVKDVFIVVALLCVGTLVFYAKTTKTEVTTTSKTKVVDAKVTTEYSYMSFYRMTLLSDGDVISLEHVKNGGDFYLGDKVRGIKNVTKTTHTTNVFGVKTSHVSRYIELKGK